MEVEIGVFENWPANADYPTDRLFGGLVEELEPAHEEPDPETLHCGHGI